MNHQFHDFRGLRREEMKLLSFGTHEFVAVFNFFMDLMSKSSITAAFRRCTNLATAETISYDRGALKVILYLLYSIVWTAD
jgi:hypothetical protein